MLRHPPSNLSCLRCQTPLAFAGTKRFHEGTLFWDTLGGIFELFKNREHFDVYVCPHCGKVEFFVEGVGDDLRGKSRGTTASLEPPGLDPWEGFDLLTEAAELEMQERWEQALARYEEVLRLSSHVQHHDLARSRIQLLQEMSWGRREET
jgi:hypothetical protein